MVTRMTPVVHAWDDGHRIEPATHEYRVSPNVDLSLSGLTDYYGGLTDAFPAQQTAAAVFRYEHGVPRFRLWRDQAGAVRRNA